MAVTTQAAPSARQNLLTINEFAEALGLSPKTIRMWIWRREVPFVRVRGHAIRFKPETVDAIIREGEVKQLKPAPRRSVPRTPTSY